MRQNRRFVMQKSPRRLSGGFLVQQGLSAVAVNFDQRRLGLSFLPGQGQGLQHARHVVAIGCSLLAHVALATAVHFEVGSHLWTVLLETGFFLARSRYRLYGYGGYCGR